jgi:hypothetical protein
MTTLNKNNPFLSFRGEEVSSKRKCYRIKWNLIDDDGANLGEMCDEHIDNISMSCEDQEEIEIYNVDIVLKCAGYKVDGQGFIFNTKADVVKAFRIAEKALTHKNPINMPAWAIEALSHGWKKPKGWKP